MTVHQPLLQWLTHRYREQAPSHIVFCCQVNWGLTRTLRTPRLTL